MTFRPIQIPQLKAHFLAPIYASTYPSCICYPLAQYLSENEELNPAFEKITEGDYTNA